MAAHPSFSFSPAELKQFPSPSCPKCESEDRPSYLLNSQLPDRHHHKASFWNRKYEMQRWGFLYRESWVLVPAELSMLYPDPGAVIEPFSAAEDTTLPTEFTGWLRKSRGDNAKGKNTQSASLLCKVKIIPPQRSGLGLGCAHWAPSFSALLVGLPSFGSPVISNLGLFPASRSQTSPNFWSSPWHAALCTLREMITH